MLTATTNDYCRRAAITHTFFFALYLIQCLMSHFVLIYNSTRHQFFVVPFGASASLRKQRICVHACASQNAAFVIYSELRSG